MKYEKKADAEKRIGLYKSSTYDVTGYMNVLECAPHFHESKEFLFVSSGKQVICSNGEVCTLKDGDIYFTDSYLPHLYEKSTAEGYVLVVRGYYFRYFEEMFSGKIIPSLLNDKQVNLELFDIIEKWYEDGINDVLLNVSYIYKLLSKIVLHYGVAEPSNKKQDDIIQKMLEYIEENYTKNIDLASLAKHINYSMVYCSKIWNNYIKENFRDYVNRYRVQKVCERIAKKENRQTILQIAFDEGFESQSTFYRAYKKVYGKTPTSGKKK